MVDAHSQRCGILILNRPLLFTCSITWPFVKIVVNKESISIALFRYRVNISKDAIKSIRLIKGLLSRGIFIQYRTRSLHSLVAWPSYYYDLRNALADLGYAIDDSEVFLYTSKLYWSR